MANIQKNTKIVLDESEIKYKDSESKTNNAYKHSEIKNHHDSKLKQTNEVRKSRSHTKTEEFRLMQLKQVVAKKMKT